MLQFWILLLYGLHFAEGKFNTNDCHAYLRAYLSAVGVGVAISVVLCLVSVPVAAAPRVTVLGGEQEVEQGSQRCGSWFWA